MPLAYLCAGCGRTMPKRGRCRECSRPANRAKAQRQNYREVYQSARWRRLRASILTRDGHECAMCGGQANTVDHLEPFDGAGDPLAWDPDYLQSLCLRCHGRKDATRGQHPLPALRLDDDDLANGRVR